MRNEDIVKLEQQIKELRQEQRYEEALVLCETVDNINVDLQRIKILLELVRMNKQKYFDKLEEANRLCDKYADDRRFIEKRKNIESLTKIVENEEATFLLTMLHFDSLELDDIDRSKLVEWDRFLLKIAYYHKYQKNNGLKFIKELKRKFQDDKDKIKVLNNLQNYVASKKTFFDPCLYTKYLKCTVDLTLDHLIKEKKEEPPVKKEKTVINIQPPVKKQEIKPEPKKEVSSFVSSTGKRVNNRYSQNNLLNKNNDNSIKVEVLLIKDVFAEEVLSIQKYLYVMMNDFSQQTKAIKAWDKFEYLINKKIDDKKALSDMINLLTRISKKDNLIIENYNPEKYQKMLAKKQ